MAEQFLAETNAVLSERGNKQRYPTLAEARTGVFRYIEAFHNPRMRRRLQAQDQKFSALFKPSA